MRQAIIGLSNIQDRQQPRRNDRRSLGHHAGLLLQRLLVDAKLDQSTKRENEKRSSELKAVLHAAITACQHDTVKTLYEAAYARWQASFSASVAYKSESLTTAGRLIVGLGSENILETGLRLHHTYGVPIIPGSALKGLASHYCDEVWGQRHLHDEAPPENKRFRRKRGQGDDEGDCHRLLFGTTEDGGVITFHDAWIVPQSLTDGALRLDVMTPHHPKWQTNEAPPTDFDSPVPVSFLSVAGTFDVRLSWLGPVGASQDEAEAWTNLAMRLLQEALAEWGVGGKTSSGYGRLVPADSVANNRQSPPNAAAKPRDLPKPGRKVEAQLLEERTKKGGWRATHAPSGLSGPVQNNGDVPSDKKAGDVLELIVASATERGVDFRYPTSADEARAHRSSSGKGQGGRGKGGRRK